MNERIAAADHVHDWRVRPDALIFSVGDKLRIELKCAVAHCGIERAVMVPPRRPAVNAKDVTTWRRFVWQQ